MKRFFVLILAALLQIAICDMAKALDYHGPGGANVTGAANTFSQPQVFSSTISAFAIGVGTGIPQGAQIQVNTAVTTQQGIRFTNNATGATSSDGAFFGVNSSGFPVMVSSDNASLGFGNNGNDADMRFTADDGLFLAAVTATATLPSSGFAGIMSMANSSVTKLKVQQGDGSISPIGIFSYSTTSIAALSAGQAGEFIYSNTVGRTCLCMSTGTGVGAWVIAFSTSIPCDQ